MSAASARVTFALLLLLCPSMARAQGREFVRVRDGRFQIGSRPYRFVGVNYWHGMNLGAGEAADRARLARELDTLQRLGVTNLRVLAASEGPVSAPQRVSRSRATRHMSGRAGTPSTTATRARWRSWARTPGGWRN